MSDVTSVLQEVFAQSVDSRIVSSSSDPVVLVGYVQLLQEGAVFGWMRSIYSERLSRRLEHSRKVWRGSTRLQLSELISCYG